MITILFKKRELKKISIIALILISAIFISITISAALILNLNYFETAILEEQTEKYLYISEDISTQISTADSIFMKLEDEDNIDLILNGNHDDQDSVYSLYNAIDFDNMTDNLMEDQIVHDFKIFTTNPTALLDGKIEFLSTAIQQEDWYHQISTSRRSQTITVIDNDLYALYRFNISPNPENYINIGMVKLDLTTLKSAKLKNFNILVTNAALDFTGILGADQELKEPLDNYLNISGSTYYDEQMILQYDIVPGTTLSKWNLVIVTDKVDILGEFLQYAAIIFAVLSILAFVIFYRLDFIREVNRSFDNLSPESIQAIISSNKPNKIEKFIKNLYEKVENLVKSNQELQFINQQKEAQKNEAEIKALLSQISPHYIFNLLNSIHKRALKNNENESARMILLMSKQLRRSLEWKESFVTIEDELNHIRSYIELQQYYYGVECEFNYDIDESLYPIKVPKLIFQTLIENALKHGVKTSPFYIQLKEKDEFISFSITNEVEGKSKDAENRITNVLYSEDESDNNEGIGLQNMVKRLDYYYNSNFRVTTHKYKHNISITITFPKSL